MRTINDVQWRYLAQKTGLRLTFNDMYFIFLRSLGYTGTLQDMIRAYGRGLKPSIEVPTEDVEGGVMADGVPVYYGERRVVHNG